MSVEAISWVLNHSTTIGTHRLVLIGIANHADPDGANAWPAIATLARYARVSERTVQRCLADLVEHDHLSVQVKAGGLKHHRDDRRPNLYRINGVTAVSPRQEPRGDRSSVHEVTDEAARGDTAVSPEPSLEPSKEEPSSTSTRTPQLPLVPDTPFEDFWQTYPKRNNKRLGRGTCETLWEKLNPEDRSAALVGAMNYADAVGLDLTIACDPERFLRRRAWEDWQEPAVPDVRRNGNRRLSTVEESAWNILNATGEAIR